MDKKLILLTLLILVSFSGVSALGITPSRIILDFEPNMKSEHTVCVIYSSPAVINVSASGGLAKYVSLDKNQLVFEEVGKQKQCIDYTLSLPATLTPGKNTAHVTASETEASGGTMGTIISVGQQLWVMVPFPGKYLTASLEAPDVEAGEPVEFSIHLASNGKEVISKISGNIEIINQNNMSLGSLPTTEIENLKSGASSELKAIWAPSSRDIGTYTAKATVNYDEKTAESETTFKIGEMNLDIIDVTRTEIEKGTTGKIRVNVESVWISQIPDVYAEIKAVGITEESSHVTVDSWSKKTLFVYFPTDELEAGEYPARAIVYYADKTVEKEFTLKIYEDKTTSYFMVGISVVLILVIILMVFFFIKQKEYKRKMQSAMYYQQ